MRIATIRIRKNTSEAFDDAKEQLLAAWRTGAYQGEVLEFESPAALFRVLTPRRWELVERLQAAGPQSIRGLGRLLGRDVKRVHEDVMTLIDFGLIERGDDGKVAVPFEEIRADFALRSVA